MEIQPLIDAAATRRVHAPEVVAIGSFITRYLVDPATGEGGGSYALVEHTLGAGMLGAPPHRHQREDECSYVLDGTLTVWRPGSLTTVGPGESVNKPRGEWHTFWNAGTHPVRFLEIIAPGAFASYFRELEMLLAPRLAAGKPPDTDAVGALARRYGLEFDFEAMGKIIGEHGLKLG